MTLTELLEKPTAAIVDWLVADAHTAPESREGRHFEQEALNAARAGDLTDVQIERWAAANWRAGHLLIAEAGDLRRYAVIRHPQAFEDSA